MEPSVNGDFGEAQKAIPGGGDGFLGTTPADVWISKEFEAVVDADEEDGRGGVSEETAETEKADVLTMEESQIVAKATGTGERVVFDELSERQEVVAVEISGAGDFAVAVVESVEGKIDDFVDEEVVTEGMVSNEKKSLANSQEVLEVIKQPSTVASMEKKIFPDSNGKTAEDSSGFGGSSPQDPPQPAVDVGKGKNADESSGLVELLESEVVKTGGVGDHGSETQVPEIAENENDNAAPPHPREPTSWRNCCGMFDVLRRSD